MKRFQDYLACLPDIDGIARLELLEHGHLVATIENKPGSQGSVRIYNHLAQVYGAITPEAARQGLVLYAEHTRDALAHPGKHPNIDRLIDLEKRGATLQTRGVSH